MLFMYLKVQNNSNSKNVLVKVTGNHCMVTYCDLDEDIEKFKRTVR